MTYCHSELHVCVVQFHLLPSSPQANSQEFDFFSVWSVIPCPTGIKKNRVRQLINLGLLSTSPTSVRVQRGMAIFAAEQKQKQTFCQERNAFLEFIEQTILHRVIHVYTHVYTRYRKKK